jgi:UDP-3-O-[3-hydroxymyristoyl] N-acetylglucosamine deacetylase
MLHQRTLRAPVRFQGIGVHTARAVRVTLRPAAVGTGIRFLRTDQGDPTSIPAHVDHVADTLLATTLGAAGITVSTVEHLLSALAGEAIDNALVEVAGPEIPILDGSAAPFVAAIRSTGTVEQGAPRRFIRITERVQVGAGDAWAALEPWAGFKASYTFVANHPVYNRYPKHADVDFTQSDYLTAVGRARSFGLLAELPGAQAAGRCLGSSLDNAVGIADDAVLNPEGLRCPDEFVRHKILDAVGDLYLLGAPLVAAFAGHKSGHSLNCALVRELLARPHAFELVEERSSVGAVRRRRSALPVG